ncbi:MAG TPA: hypothetical protein VGI60_17790 [Chthoniobacterales bacterium]
MRNLSSAFQSSTLFAAGGHQQLPIPLSGRQDHSECSSEKLDVLGIDAAVDIQICAKIGLISLLDAMGYDLVDVLSIDNSVASDVAAQNSKSSGRRWKDATSVIMYAG